MRKNIAGQAVGAEMIAAADGSAFTGAVSVFVTLDAGTQAAGTVGGGACTHEGNGYHTYAPAQAETNGDLVAFTFTGTGAIPRTVQIYTAPADLFADIGDVVAAALDDYGALRPTVAGRKLNVNGAGEADAQVVGATVAAMEAFADALLNRDWTLVSDSNARTLLNAARFLRNKWGVPLGTLTVTKEDDTTVAWTAATATTAGVNTITEVDPA